MRKYMQILGCLRSCEMVCTYRAGRAQQFSEFNILQVYKERGKSVFRLFCRYFEDGDAKNP